MLEQPSTIVVLDSDSDTLEEYSKVFNKELKLRGIVHTSSEGFEESVLSECPQVVAISLHFKDGEGNLVREGHKMVDKLKKDSRLKNTVFIVLVDEDYGRIKFFSETIRRNCDQILSKPIGEDKLKDRLVKYAYISHLNKQMDNHKLLNFDIRKTNEFIRNLI